MKQTITKSIFIASVLFCGGMVQAQTSQDGTVVVRQQLVERAGDKLMVNMTLDLSQLQVSSNRSVVCTPLIEGGDSLYALPSLVINGRNRQIQYERSERNWDDKQLFAVRRQNKQEQTFDYHASIPFKDWMRKSEVLMVTDLCGCGWEALQNDKSALFPINLEPKPLVPALAFMAPPVEEVKARSKEGSAFLDFPVNKIVIYPEYRNNTVELQKIRETIESVRNDKYATITEVYIKGYASPEGGYKNNSYLAENRAKALSKYVKDLYAFADARFTVEFEPEDWEGLTKRVETSSLADKDKILEIIHADEPKDWDAREWKLKKLPSYQTMLREIYPALRHSDYAVKYTIRNFTVEEAKALIYTDPKQLSLNEMFQVAQTLEPGSEAYREVFEIAVRMYPNDPVSNLNAAMNAIAVGRIDAARRYLTKAPASPEKELAEANILLLEGKLDESKAKLETLKGNPSIASQVEDNLKQIAERE
ncbi:MAG: DUF3868 domain-containing protein [Parabacteroides sp.]|nr:DUF3868 domain-containing protein [Parabacteroides sp.]